MDVAVLFLVFNRPETTAEVFAAIRSARPTRLYVAADGPRSSGPGEADLCKETRAIATAIDWDCELRTLFRDGNLGCKKAVSSAITWFFEQEEEGVILEDDCLPDASFFSFCQNLLEYYRHDERIMMISGFNSLLDRFTVAESYLFIRYYSIWGWASWRRAWQKYDITMKEWPQRRADGELRRYFDEAFMRRHLVREFNKTYSGEIDTWDNQWFYSCLFSNGLSVIPRVNLITNIGVVGAHASEFSEHIHYPFFPLDTDNLVHPDQVCPNIHYQQQYFSNYFKPTIRGLLKKIAVALRKRGLLPK